MGMATACVTSQLSLSQMHHMNSCFKTYDSSGDGRLSHAEMRQVLRDVGINANEDAELVIESLDCDRSGMIEYSEFVSGCLDIASDSMRDQLQVAFSIFDLDGSGSISLDELRQVLTVGPNAEALVVRRASTPPLQGTKSGASDEGGTSVMLPDGKTAAEVMKDLDKDGTNRVEFPEFQRYLLGEHERIGRAMHDAQATD